MDDKQVLAHASAVAALAANLPGECRDEPQERYSHMGALLADAVLQAGMNYRTVVAPRVNRVLERFPHAATTPTFRDVLAHVGPASVLQWSNPEKPLRLLLLTNFLFDNCVFTTTAFQTWLLVDTNCAHLAGVRGIGPKTLDYLKCLCGIDAVAVDRHIRKFVAKAGVQVREYATVQKVIEQAADLMQISRSELDRIIWSSESQVWGDPLESFASMAALESKEKLQLTDVTSRISSPKSSRFRG